MFLILTVVKIDKTGSVKNQLKRVDLCSFCPLTSGNIPDRLLHLQGWTNEQVKQLGPVEQATCISPLSYDGDVRRFFLGSLSDS